MSNTVAPGYGFAWHALSTLDDAQNDEHSNALPRHLHESPRYDPYSQSTEDFNIETSLLFNAPSFHNINILGPRPSFLDRVQEPTPRSLSLSSRKTDKSRGRACGRGHLHSPWPANGSVVIEKCERFCWFCKLQVKTAATLRKHVVQQHRTKDGMSIVVVASTSGRSRNVVNVEREETVDEQGVGEENIEEPDVVFEKGIIEITDDTDVRPGAMSAKSTENTTHPSVEDAQELHHVEIIDVEGNTSASAPFNSDFSPLLSQPSKQRIRDDVELSRLRADAAELSRQQIHTLKKVRQIYQDNSNLLDQAFGYQNLHNRHESSINAVLTFLATFYNSGLEDDIAETVDLFNDRRKGWD